MARTINCFVSFSAKDGDEKDIRFLISYLESRLNSKVKFKAYYNMRSGEDLQDFMKNDLDESEAVIALFTPDYKAKADQGVRSGVYTEFLHIVDRIEGRRKGSMRLIPIFWNGADFDSSVPKYFMNHNMTRNLQEFHAFGATGEPFLPKRVEMPLRSIIDSIVEDLELRWLESDPDYPAIEAGIDQTMGSTVDEASSTFNEDERQNKGLDAEGALFVKAERAPMPLPEFNQKLFVKTAAFRAVRMYHRMAFTGRKGSGKTTLLKIYKYQNQDRYFFPIDIEVNDWNLHYILGDLTFIPREGDLSYTQEESKIFDFIWPIFLSLCIVRSLRESKLEIKLENLIPNNRFTSRFIACESRFDALFSLSIEVVTAFIQSAIDISTSNSESEFKSDLLQILNVQNCTEYLLGEDYSGIKAAISSDPKNRRFLFCLDRFDTEIQIYRKDLKQRNISQEDRERREAREVYWIQGLVEMIDHLRSPDYFSMNQKFYKAIGPDVDFCVPLPMDRLYEVQLRRRDSIVGDINEEINWQPYELLTMLRKRMQVIWKIDNNQIDRDKYVGAKDRYDRVVEISNRKIPTQVDVKTNGSKFPMNLFLNVLRHTFFRPRDINIYYSRILSAVEAAHKRHQKLSPSAITRLISEQTHRIVKHEFLGEFSDTFRNVRDVVHLFRGSPQLLTFEELDQKLSGVIFEIYGGNDIFERGKKIRFLYEIGFIGVCSANKPLGNMPVDDYDFYFFNPLVASALEQEEVLLATKFAIHPVFIEYLPLILNATVPVMMLDWEKVDALDAFD